MPILTRSTRPLLCNVMGKGLHSSHSRPEFCSIIKDDSRSCSAQAPDNLDLTHAIQKTADEMNKKRVSLIFTNCTTFNIKCSFLFLISSLVVKVFNSTIKRHEMIKQKVSILKYHPNKMLLLLVLVGLSLLSALISNNASVPTCSYSKCQAQVQFLKTQVPQQNPCPNQVPKRGFELIQWLL